MTSMNGGLIKIGSLFAVAILLKVLPVQNALACTPIIGDRWFDMHISVDHSTLPNGVEIIQTGYDGSLPYALVNRNSEPFYLVKDVTYRFINPNDPNAFDPANIKIDESTGLPQNYEPRHKVTKENAYQWRLGFGEDFKSWRVVDRKKNFFESIFDSSEPRIGINESALNLMGRSHQREGWDRPENARIPEPQNFTILGYYKGSPVEITGQVSYSINKDYDPNIGGGGCDSDSSYDLKSTYPSSVYLFIGIIITLGLVSGAGLLIYEMVRRKK